MSTGETPLRRTARARKINSRFIGDDIDEGYRKLVGRITASHHTGNDAAETKSLDKTLESNDNDSKSSKNDDKTQAEVKQSTSDESKPNIVKKANTKLPEEESVEEKGFHSSKIVRWRSSTESDSEASGDCFQATLVSKHKVYQARGKDNLKRSTNLQDALGDAMNSFSDKNTNVSQLISVQSGSNDVKSIGEKILLKSIVIKGKSYNVGHSSKLKNASLPVAPKEEATCPFSSEGEDDVPLTKLIKKTKNSSKEKSPLIYEDHFNKLIETNNPPKEKISDKTSHKIDAAKKKKLGNYKIKTCNVLLKKATGLSVKNKAEEISHIKKINKMKMFPKNEQLKGVDTSNIKFKAKDSILKNKKINFFGAPKKNKKLPISKTKPKKSAKVDSTNFMPGGHLVTLSSLVLELPAQSGDNSATTANKNNFIKQNKKFKNKSNLPMLKKDKRNEIKSTPTNLNSVKKLKDKHVNKKRKSDASIDRPPSKLPKIEDLKKVKMDKSGPATSELYVVESNSVNYVVEASLSQSPSKQKAEKITLPKLQLSPIKIPSVFPTGKSTNDKGSLIKVEKLLESRKEECGSERLQTTCVTEKSLSPPKLERVEPPIIDTTLKNITDNLHKHSTVNLDTSECETGHMIIETKTDVNSKSAPEGNNGLENDLPKTNIVIKTDNICAETEQTDSKILKETSNKYDILSPESFSSIPKPLDDKLAESSQQNSVSLKNQTASNIDTKTDCGNNSCVKQKDVNEHRNLEVDESKETIEVKKLYVESTQCPPVLKSDSSREGNDAKLPSHEIKTLDGASDANEDNTLHGASDSNKDDTLDGASDASKDNTLDGASDANKDDTLDIPLPSQVSDNDHSMSDRKSSEKSEYGRSSSEDKRRSADGSASKKRNHELHKQKDYSHDRHKHRSSYSSRSYECDRRNSDYRQSRSHHSHSRSRHDYYRSRSPDRRDRRHSRHDVNESRSSKSSRRSEDSSRPMKVNISNKLEVEKIISTSRQSIDNIGTIVTITNEGKMDSVVANITKEDKSNSVLANITKEDKSDSVLANSTKEHKSESVLANITREDKSDSVHVNITKEDKSDSVLVNITKEDKSDSVLANITKEDKSHSVLANITKEDKSHSVLADITKEDKSHSVLADVTKEDKACASNDTHKPEVKSQLDGYIEEKKSVKLCVTEPSKGQSMDKEMSKVAELTPNTAKLSGTTTEELNICNEKSSDITGDGFVKPLNVDNIIGSCTTVKLLASIETKPLLDNKIDLHCTEKTVSNAGNIDKYFEAPMPLIQMQKNSAEKEMDFSIKEEDKFDISLWPKSFEETMQTLDIPLPPNENLAKLSVKKESNMSTSAINDFSKFSPAFPNLAPNLKIALEPSKPLHLCMDTKEDEITLVDMDDNPIIEIHSTRDKFKQAGSESSIKETLSAEEKENINNEVVKQRLKSFVHLNENLYLNEKTRITSKEVRRMVCDCILSKEEIKNGDKGCGDDCLNRLLMIECGSRCPLQDRCMNKQFQERHYSKVEVFNADEKGCGIMATQDIVAGSFIMEYIGEVFGAREFKRRRREYAKGSSAHFYFMALRADNLIDATRKGNISRFINHSCDPNAETQKWTVNGELRIGFFATKHISAKEEINFDYRLERYGQEPQKCYCGTAICRGWLGESPEEKTKEEIEEDKKKQLRDKKRREEKRALFDNIDMEEEIEKLSLRGLRNRQDTLDLSRLMVRAEDCSSRLLLLQLLNDSEKACKRLFLDYHGLKLLWSWMVDLGIVCDYYALKLQVLQTLERLPITNRTQLTDSKVLSIVERWSKQVHSPPESASLSPEETRPSDEENNPPASKTSSDMSEKNLESGQQSSSPDDSSLDSESSVKRNDTNKTGFNFLRNLLKEASKDLKGREGTTEKVKEIIPEEAKDGAAKKTEDVEATIEKAKDRVVAMAEKLLMAWSTLSEAFRIPKKERIQIMKEHEREVEKGFIEYLNREWSGKRSSYGNWSVKDNSEKRRKRRSRNRDRESERKRMEIYEDSGLSKEERREQFAIQVAKEEEDMRYRKSLQEAVWNLHMQRCAMLSSNPSFTPMFDGSGQFFWNPLVGNWQPFMGQCENLPVPALYGAICGEDQSSPSLYPESLFVSGVSPEYMDTFVQGIPLPGQVTQYEISPNELSTGTPPLIQPHQLCINLPPMWRVASCTDGNAYFYNTKTRTSQWAAPTPERHQELLKEFGMAGSEFDVESSSTTSSDSDEFSSEEETEDQKPESVAVVCASDGTEEKMIRRHRGKRKRSDKLVQERVISPITVDNRLVAREERRLAKERAQEEARKERWQAYMESTSSSKEQEDADDDLLNEDDPKPSRKQKTTDGKTHRYKSKSRAASALADHSEHARKIKDSFRSRMATFIVGVLNPYRKSDCKEGRIVTTEDFKYLARKLTHFVMVKELKQLPSIDDLLCNDSVKNKTKEFVRKYMSKYGSNFKRDPNDTKEY